MYIKAHAKYRRNLKGGNILKGQTTFGNILFVFRNRHKERHRLLAGSEQLPNVQLLLENYFPSKTTSRKPSLLAGDQTIPYLQQCCFLQKL